MCLSQNSEYPILWETVCKCYEENDDKLINHWLWGYGVCNFQTNLKETNDVNKVLQSHKLKVLWLCIGTPSLVASGRLGMGFQVITTQNAFLALTR